MIASRLPETRFLRKKETGKCSRADSRGVGSHPCAKNAQGWGTRGPTSECRKRMRCLVKSPLPAMRVRLCVALKGCTAASGPHATATSGPHASSAPGTHASVRAKEIAAKLIRVIDLGRINGATYAVVAGGPHLPGIDNGPVVVTIPIQHLEAAVEIDVPPVRPGNWIGWPLHFIRGLVRAFRSAVTMAGGRMRRIAHRLGIRRSKPLRVGVCRYRVEPQPQRGAEVVVLIKGRQRLAGII